MVEWYWLLVAFFAGSFVGILMTAMMMAIEKEDDNERRGLR